MPSFEKKIKIFCSHFIWDAAGFINPTQYSVSQFTQTGFLERRNKYLKKFGTSIFIFDRIFHYFLVVFCLSEKKRERKPNQKPILINNPNLSGVQFYCLLMGLLVQLCRISIYLSGWLLLIIRLWPILINTRTMNPTSLPILGGNSIHIHHTAILNGHGTEPTHAFSNVTQNCPNTVFIL